MSAGLLNDGVRVVRPPNTAPRTLIVTGPLRSGTSMVAAMLQRAGIFIGNETNDIVYEDEELDRILRSGDAIALRRVIGEPDAAYRVVPAAVSMAQSSAFKVMRCAVGAG